MCWSPKKIRPRISAAISSKIFKFNKIKKFKCALFMPYFLCSLRLHKTKHGVKIMYKIKTKYKTDNLMSLSELLDSIKNINVSDIPTNKTNFDLLNQIANKLKNNHKQFEKLCITNKKCKRKLTGKIIYVDAYNYPQSFLDWSK